MARIRLAIGFATRLVTADRQTGMRPGSSRSP
jgi:hypothetical protein